MTPCANCGSGPAEPCARCPAPRGSPALRAEAARSEREARAAAGAVDVDWKLPPRAFAAHHEARARLFDRCAEAADRCDAGARATDAHEAQQESADRGRMTMELVSPAALVTPTGLRRP